MSALTQKDRELLHFCDGNWCSHDKFDSRDLCALVRRLAARVEELEGLLLRECLAHDHLAVHGKTMPGHTHEEWKQIRTRTPSEGNEP